MTGLVVVADASPLIALSAIDRLGILEALYGAVVVPPAVWDEVVLRGGSRPGAAELAGAAWARVAEVRDDRRVETLLARLDRGESEALCLYLELQADVLLLDDREARAVAAEMGVRVLGTLGVLVDAKRSGLVASLTEELSRLERAHFRLGARERRRALRAAGEEP